MSLIRTAALATLVLRATPAPAPAVAPPRASLVDALAITYMTSNYYCENAAPDSKLPTVQWRAATYDQKTKNYAWAPATFGKCHTNFHSLQPALAYGVHWLRDGAEAGMTALIGHYSEERAAAYSDLKEIYGVALFDPEKDTGTEIPRYDGKVLAAVADKLYLKPTDKLGASTAQAVYDAMFKQTVADFVHNIVRIESKLPKAKLAKLANDYKTAAAAKPSKPEATFYGPDFLGEMTRKQLTDSKNPRGDALVLGVLLRRQLDGTWPVVTQLLKRVMADYDPALSKEVGNKL